MRIWIDADACPKAIKDILYRAVIRTKIQMILVANQPLQTPISTFIKKIQVSSGFDVADKYIVDNMQKGDLVITADIPLADGAINKGGYALNPRGELYTKENIKEKLSVRNLNAEFRSGGLTTGGPAKLSNKENQAFANSLDSFLAKNK
jgi:uncharacterized protein YaiI (UPF0178 family)